MNGIRNVLIAALASAAATSLAMACGGSTNNNSGAPDASASSGSGGSSGSSSGSGSSGGSSSGGRGGRGDGGPRTGCTDFNGCNGQNICCTVAGTTGASTQTICTDSDASAPTCPPGTQQVCSGANTNNTCSPGGDVTLGPCNFSCNAISGSTYSVCVPMTGVNCDAGSGQGGGGDAMPGSDGGAADSESPPQDAASQ